MSQQISKPVSILGTPIEKQHKIARAWAEMLHRGGWAKAGITVELEDLVKQHGFNLDPVTIAELADCETLGGGLLPFMPSDEFDDTEFVQEAYIPGILYAGQPAIVGGASKSMKTTIGIIDLGLSIASGADFLGKFPVTKTARVGIISGESGPATIQRNARTICSMKGIRLRDQPIHWSFEIPQLTDASALLEIKRFIRRYDIGVLMIDPTYLALLDSESAGQAGNLFAMGSRLRELSDLAAETGVTPLMAHHARKIGKFDPNRFAPPELHDLSMSGFAEWARQWLLFGRRETYRQGTGIHRLWLNVGGSFGHSGLFALDVDEGIPCSPRWDVIVRTADEVQREEAEEREAVKEQKAIRKRQQQRSKLVDRVLEATGTIGDFASRRQIRLKAGLNNDTASESLFADLVEHGFLESKTDTPNGQKPTTMYRLAEGAGQRDRRDVPPFCPTVPA